MSFQDEPLIFEVESRPSLIVLIIKRILSVNYFQIPMIFIILFHIFWFFLLSKFKNSLILSSIQFLLSCFFIYVSAPLNTFLSNHYKSFYFKDDYFDQSCIFIFVFWAFPFISACFIIIVSMFIDLCKSIAVHRYFDSIVAGQQDQNSENNDSSQNNKKKKSD